MSIRLNIGVDEVDIANIDRNVLSHRILDSNRGFRPNVGKEVLETLRHKVPKMLKIRRI